MCSLAPLLWRSFFVCIVFGCRILRILYQARYFFPKLTYRPKSGATDGGHAPELSSTALSNHDLFAWKLETTQSTSSQYHNIMIMRLHKNMDWKSTDEAFSSRAHELRISIQHCLIVLSYVMFLFCLCTMCSDHGGVFRWNVWMDRRGGRRVLLVCVESLICITQVELVLSN